MSSPSAATSGAGCQGGLAAAAVFARILASESATAARLDASVLPAPPATETMMPSTKKNITKPPPMPATSSRGEIFLGAGTGGPPACAPKLVPPHTEQRQPPDLLANAKNQTSAQSPHVNTHISR